MKLSAKPEVVPGQDNVYVYKSEDNQNTLLDIDSYEFCVSSTEPRQ